MCVNRFESQVSLGTRDVTRSGAQGEFAMAGRSNRNQYTIGHVSNRGGATRCLQEHTRGPYRVRCFTNRHDLVELRWEEGFAPLARAETAEHIRIAVCILLIEDADGGTPGPWIAQPLQNLVERVRFGSRRRR